MMKKRNFNRLTLLGASALALSLSMSCAVAENFDIPPQPLSTALREFGLQSGLSIVYEPSTSGAQTVQSPGLSGEWDSAAGLEHLLSGTGLVAIPVDGGFVIKAAERERASVPQAATQSPESSSNTALDEIVVTAQRREERLQDVPLTLTALSSDEVTKSGGTSIVDLRNVVSGLNFSGVGNATLSAIRGVSTGVTTNGGENPNALYVDGVYYSQQQLLGSQLPDVDRIEVLKGPQGTLFGRNSVGGAVRIFTKNPTFEPTGDITIEGGMYTGSGHSRSAPHTNVRGFVSAPLIDELAAVSLSGGYDSTDGFLTNDANGKRFGTIRRKNVRAKLLVEPNDATRILLSAFYLKHEDQGLLAGTPLDGRSAANIYPGSVIPSSPYHSAFDSGLGIDFNTSPIKSHGFSGIAEFRLPIGTLTSTTGYSDTSVETISTVSWSRGSAECIASFACIDYTYHFKNKSFSEELNFASERFGIFSFTGGLFYYHEDAKSDAAIQAGLIPGGIFPQAVQFDIKSYAAYGELRAEPTSDLTLIVGGRYTHEPHDDAILVPTVIRRKENFNSFIPRLSALYALTPYTNVYATYSQGEKSGLSGVANEQSTPPFAKVDPEKLKAYEVGVKYARNDLALNVSGYYYDYKNKQEQVFTGTSGIIQNTGPVRIYGFDVDATYRLMQGFTARANVTWIPEAEYRDFPNAAGFALTQLPNGSFESITFDATGERLLRAPEVTGNLSLDYERTVRDGTLDASLNVSYSSSVLHDYLVHQSAFTTVGARAGYSFANGLRIGVYGRNLTNEEYITSALVSAGGFTAAYAQPREVGVSLSYSY